MHLVETQDRIHGVDGGRYRADSAEYHAYVRRYDAAYMQFHAPELARTQARVQRMIERGVLRAERVDARAGVRVDANNSAFLARQLLFVRGTMERKIYEAQRMREFVDVEPHPRGAQSYATQMLDMTGEAKVTHDLAGDDPRVDVSVEEDLGKYVNVRASYAYTMQDLEYAAFAGVPLPMWKQEACVDAISRKTDSIGRVGDAASGITGFFNNANVNVVTLTNGEWLTASADEIVADWAQIEQALISQSKDTLPNVAYRLVLPTAYEGRLMTLARSSASDMSVGEWLLKTARVIRSIERYRALDDATGADTGVADDPMGICYPKTPQTLYWPISIAYEEIPPQVDGWEWITHARARVSGVDIRRPVQMLYIENLD